MKANGMPPYYPLPAWKSGLLAALIIVCLLLAPAAPAAPVTAAQAQAVVQHWLAQNPAPLGTALPPRIAGVSAYGAAAAPLYYVVAFSPTGYVVVAGDDRIEPIIAFVPMGTFNPSPARPLGALVSGDLPKRLARLNTPPAPGAPSAGALQRAATRAQQKWASLLAADRSLPETSVAAVSDPRVDPFTQTTWSQQSAGDEGSAACYNYYTPPNAAGNVNNYPSGCVATAMAQLMRFWQYPVAGVGPAAFTIYVDGGCRVPAVARRRRQRRGTVGEYAVQHDIRHRCGAMPGHRRALCGCRGGGEYALHRQ